MANSETASLEAPYLSVNKERSSPFDPPNMYARAAGQSDIVELRFHAGHSGWLVTGYDLAKTVLADRRFSVRPDLAQSPGAQQLRTFVAPGLFHQLDSPEHTRLRGTVTGEFTPARMEALKPTVALMAKECLDRLEAAGPNADLMQHVAFPFPLLIISEFLGIPVELRQRFVSHALAVVAKERPDDDRAAALVEIIDFLRPLLHLRARDPQDDLLSRLVSRSDIDTNEAAGVAAQLLVAGAMVPSAMLGFGIYALLDAPGGMVPFAGDEKEAANAVEELLRYLSFEAQPRIRVAVEDVMVGQVLVQRGQLVAVAIDAGNRDASKYPNPDVLDFDRDTGGHLAFGWGPHQCLGQSLARMELKTILPAMARRFPKLGLSTESRLVPVVDEGIARTVARLQVQW